MKGSNIHHLNSILILVSCLIAFYLPFELFLFAYGILGPLHYLTEISWLHKKKYYTKHKYDYLFLFAACIILVFTFFHPVKSQTFSSDLLLFSLIGSIALVFIDKWPARLSFLIATIVIVSILNNFNTYLIWVAILLPTIIHVYVFTALFMLYGILKERSLPGLVSLITLFVCTSLFFVVDADSLIYSTSAYIQKSYHMFSDLNFHLIKLFHVGEIHSVSEIFSSNAGFTIMRFVSFAYVYHYLNWFSKTTVIKWHLVSKKSLIITLVIWLISIALYWIDFNLGVKMLLFLSFLHVFVEFPLNIVSIKGISLEFVNLFRRLKA